MKKYAATFMALPGVFIATAAVAGDFKLKSPDLTQDKRLDTEQVFSGFGCTGKNMSTALQWEGAPKGTKSFAVTVYDPYAPTGSGWWHWIIFNIPANITELPKNAGDPAKGSAPQRSVQSKTDFGTPGYGGACPPPGDKPHRYQLTVYALDIEKLPLDANVSGAMAGFNILQHSLEKASITVFYSR